MSSKYAHELPFMPVLNYNIPRLHVRCGDWSDSEAQFHVEVRRSCFNPASCARKRDLNLPMDAPGNVRGAPPHPPLPQPNNPPPPQGGQHLAGAGQNPIFNNIDAGLAVGSPPKHSNPKWNIPDKIDGT